MIEVHAATRMYPTCSSAFRKVPVHTVLFHIVIADGSMLPVEEFGVSIDAAEREALACHLTQTRNINGEFPAAYVPPGKYMRIVRECWDNLAA
jgi:hypothetical protein